MATLHAMMLKTAPRVTTHPTQPALVSVVITISTAFAGQIRLFMTPMRTDLIRKETGTKIMVPSVFNAIQTLKVLATVFAATVTD